jgi:hypothetical protein
MLWQLAASLGCVEVVARTVATVIGEGGGPTRLLELLDVRLVTHGRRR